MTATDCAIFLAAVLVVAGVAFIHWPTALIVAGVIVGWAAVNFERGES